MPPSPRKPATKKPADEVEKADEATPAKGGEICKQCWPRGWPAESGRSASCVHGQWSRDLPASSEA
jgi:hypothetical protein